MASNETLIREAYESFINRVSDSEIKIVTHPPFIECRIANDRGEFKTITTYSEAVYFCKEYNDIIKRHNL